MDEQKDYYEPIEKFKQEHDDLRVYLIDRDKWDWIYYNIAIAPEKMCIPLELIQYILIGNVALFEKL